MILTTPPPELPKLFSEREFAEYLGVSIHTVRRERYRGRIGHLRFGFRVYYTAEHALDYFNRNQVEPCYEPNQSIPDKSATNGFRNARTAQLGAEPGSTTALDRHDRASLGTTDFSEAKIRLAEWVTRNQTLYRERAEDVPLETILVRYYEGHAKKIPSCVQAEIALRNWSDFFPGLLVSELTPDRLEDFIESMRERGLSDGYISRTLSTGKAALNRALKRQEVDRVPYIPLLRGGDPRDRRLSLAESAALFDACKTEHLFLYLILAFTTLARTSALLELELRQIDFENRLVNLNPPGRRQNKKYRPTLPMANTLQSWLEKIEGERIIAYNGRPIASIRTAFDAARDEAGLDSSVIALYDPPHDGHRAAQARGAAVGGLGYAGPQERRIPHHGDLCEIRSELSGQSGHGNRRLFHRAGCDNVPLIDQPLTQAPCVRDAFE